MQITDILLVRHPETTANVEGRLNGRLSSPFTHTGRLQLRRVPRKIAAFMPDRIISSPLDRTRLLAERASQLCRCELVIDDRIIELDFGVAEGMTFEEIAESDFEFNFKAADKPVAPEGESRHDILLRTAAVLDELTTGSGRYVLVTHGGVFRSALVHLLGLGGDAIWSFHIHNAQLAHVRVVEGHGSLEEYVQG